MLFLVAGLSCLCFGVAAAAAVTVTNTNDAGPGSLRQTIVDAAEGETVAVPPGRYSLRTGQLLIEKSLKIAGSGPGATVLQASGQFRVLTVSGANVNLTLSGVTVRDGHPSGTDTIEGGGILVNGANLTLEHDLVTGNVAESVGGSQVAQGGAIAARGPASSVVVRETTISDNVAQAAGAAGKGGGTAEGGALRTEGKLTIQRSAISGNRADARGGQGAASAEQKGGTAEGGAIHNLGGLFAIEASTISENVADASSGPGASGGTVLGGGLQVSAGLPSSIAASTIDGNIAIARGGDVAHGGGLEARVEAGGAITIAGSTISDNLLESGGVAINGGNIFAMNPVRFADTIVSGGVGPVGSGNCSGPIESLGFNLESADECGFHASGDIVNADPGLGPLQDNGGPTPTRAPVPGSPAVDRGSSSGLATDQRGLPRPVDLAGVANAGDGSDIGAVELQAQAETPAPKPFVLGALKRNPKRGTGLLAVSVPGPGRLVLRGAGLRTQSIEVTGGGLALKLEPTGAAKRALRRRGRRSFKLEVTFAPDGGAAAKLTRTVVLTQARHRAHH